MDSSTVIYLGYFSLSYSVVPLLFLEAYLVTPLSNGAALALQT
jgi:hypothetical protein